MHDNQVLDHPVYHGKESFLGEMSKANFIIDLNATHPYMIPTRFKKLSQYNETHLTESFTVLGVFTAIIGIISLIVSVNTFSVSVAVFSAVSLFIAVAGIMSRILVKNNSVNISNIGMDINDVEQALRYDDTTVSEMVDSAVNIYLPDHLRSQAVDSIRKYKGLVEENGTTSAKEYA